MLGNPLKEYFKSRRSSQETIHSKSSIHTINTTYQRKSNTANNRYFKMKDWEMLSNKMIKLPKNSLKTVLLSSESPKKINSPSQRKINNSAEMIKRKPNINEKVITIL